MSYTYTISGIKTPLISGGIEMFGSMMIMYYLGSALGTIIFIMIIAAVVSKFRRGGNSVLILQEFNFKENEDVFLTIKGRPSGLWSWILSLFDKAPEIKFTCNKRLLRFEASKIKYYIPMIKISCVSSSLIYKFRIFFLILGIILIAAGIAIPSFFLDNPYRIALVIVGILLFLCFFLKKKTIYLGICLYENKPFISITLKKGIIKSLDDETFEAAANTLSRIVLANAISK
jgi:hypothetical protein